MAFILCVLIESIHSIADGKLRKRKSGLTKADDFKHAKKIVSFDIQQIDKIVTDFHPGDAYQSCSVFSSDGSLLATGGADGYIRLWKVSMVCHG